MSAPTPLAAQSFREVARQAVRDVDAGGRDAAQRDPEGDAGLRQLEAGKQRVARPALRRQPALKDREARRRVARACR